MDAPPPTRGWQRFVWTFRLTVALLIPASILRAFTVGASLRCLGATEFALLCIPYALLLAVGWLFKNVPAASAVVAVGAVVITALPLTVGLNAVADVWNDRGFWCGDFALLFPALQLIVAVVIVLLAGSVWLSHKALTRPR